MKTRASALAALLLAFIAATFAHAAPGVAKMPAKPSACGAPLAGALSEPPRVDMWTLPKDAGGRNELILAVHKDRDRFCYRYVSGGIAHTVAPAIHVRRGETFDLRMVNDISGPSKGETVASTALPPCMPMAMPDAPVTHHPGYLNHELDDRWMPKLTADTNVHLHGFQGPASQENVFLSTLSTPMHACEYRITVPQSQSPGTYLYHPHSHGASDVQMAGGLAGAWIVDADTPQIDSSSDHLILLGYAWPFANDYLYSTDVTPLFLEGLAHMAKMRSGPPVAYDPFDPPAWQTEFPIAAAGFTLDPTGCNGVASDGQLSVNGHKVPTTLYVGGDRQQLLRLVNATSDSPKMLELRDDAGNVVPIDVAELDGNPLSGDSAHPLARYLTVQKLMVAAANRAGLLVSVPAGKTYSLWTTKFCSGVELFYEHAEPLLYIKGTAGGSGGATLDTKAVNVDDTPAAKLLAYVRAHRQSVRRRAITFTEYVFPPRGKTPLHEGYYVTDTTNRNFRERPYYPQYAPGGTAPMRADIVVKRGSIEEWYLFNTTREAHTFHIHQMAFVLENARSYGMPNGAPITIDDMFLPVGRLVVNPHDRNYPLVKPSLTKVIMDFRNVPRGTFVFHCHMLFHEDRGMMAIIRVV